MEDTQLSLFTKTSPEPSAVRTARIGERSSNRSSKSSNREPLCLMFLKTDGPTRTGIWERDGALRTVFLMLNTGESPNAAVESTLSSILEVNAPEKYYLSAKACEGILRRAERRGKKLPEMLKLALEQMIERESAM